MLLYTINHKDIPAMRGHIALSIYKNFSTGEYQITIGVNDFNKKIQLTTLKGEYIYAYIGKKKGSFSL